MSTASPSATATGRSRELKFPDLRIVDPVTFLKELSSWQP